MCPRGASSRLSALSGHISPAAVTFPGAPGGARCGIQIQESRIHFMHLLKRLTAIAVQAVLLLQLTLGAALACDCGSEETHAPISHQVVAVQSAQQSAPQSAQQNTPQSSQPSAHQDAAEHNSNTLHPHNTPDQSAHSAPLTVCDSNSALPCSMPVNGQTCSSMATCGLSIMSVVSNSIYSNVAASPTIAESLYRAPHGTAPSPETPPPRV